jgi:hypothetical protein
MQSSPRAALQIQPQAPHSTSRVQGLPGPPVGWARATLDVNAASATRPTRIALAVPMSAPYHRPNIHGAPDKKAMVDGSPGGP